MAAIDIRDMKWLSNYMRFSTNVSDPLILSGSMPGSISVNFSSLLESDSKGDSYFVVGGRAYFEANTFYIENNNITINSYTYKGFFD